MNKDSQWLQLDVCREYQRNRCQRFDYDCKFAHPALHVDVQNGKVIACYDSMKGRCNRDQPPCKYFHPPSHLNDQLLVNGRNHLALKNAFVSHVDGLGACQSIFNTTVPNMTFLPGLPPFHPFLTADQLVNSQGMNSQIQLKNDVGFNILPDVLPEPSPTPATTSTLPKKRPVDQMDMLQMFDFNSMDSFYATTKSYVLMNPYKKPALEAHGLPIYQPKIYQSLLQSSVMPATTESVIPLNAPYVNYTDANGQLLDNLPVCQDFNRSMCTRLNCKFVHLMNHKKLEINEQRVAVCRDHANGICKRQQCKYYHIPIALPSAYEMASSVTTSNDII